MIKSTALESANDWCSLFGLPRAADRVRSVGYSVVDHPFSPASSRLCFLFPLLTLAKDLGMMTTAERTAVDRDLDNWTVSIIHTLDEIALLPRPVRILPSMLSPDKAIFLDRPISGPRAVPPNQPSVPIMRISDKRKSFHPDSSDRGRLQEMRIEKCLFLPNSLRKPDPSEASQSIELTVVVPIQDDTLGVRPRGQLPSALQFSPMEY